MARGLDEGMVLCKNDLKAREDIKDIIMRPIWQRFGLQKPKVEMDEAAEECQRAFGVICSFIGTRDLVQEHVAYRVWPLVEKWEIPKETISKPDEGGLVRLKYTFKYGDKFVEPDDDWLKSIEAISDELLGSYSKAEDTALSAAFGGWKKKRLNRVFDAIGFVYPDYRYPIRGQKRKDTASVKEVASAAPSEPTPKRKKMKVLTHRPCYIEPATVPEFVGETSSATEAKEPTPLPNVEELVIMLEMEKIEEPKARETRTSEILSPSAKVEVPKSQKGPAMTPKRRRMVNVLDVLETIKSSSTTPKKIAETPEGLFGSTPIHMDWGGLRGFQSQISQNSLQSVSIPSNPYGLKITEQALKWKLKPLVPKLQSTKLRLKLGLQSPPRWNPWKPKK
jgi:hypothetical protein